MINRAILVLANVVITMANRQAVMHYRRRTGRFPNVAYPQRYSERMLWRKLVDHNPQFIVFSDKLTTKEYTKQICPELALPKTLWIGQDVDDIPDGLLSGDVFVKTNHGYNYNYQIRGGQLDRRDLKTKTDQWLKSTHGGNEHQWAYSKIQPKLFVEESIGDASVDLLEINIRSSNGKFILGSVIGRNKKPEQWTVYLDVGGNPTSGIADKDNEPPKSLPDGMEITEPYLRAIAYAKKLSIGVDYARFDFMWNGDNLYGGEITVYPAAGNSEITNLAVHNKTINGWDLATSHFLRSEHTGFRRLYANALKAQLGV